MTRLRLDRPAAVAPDAATAGTHLLTLRDVMRHAMTRFQSTGVVYGQGCSNAHDEAAWLLLWCVHLTPDQLETSLDARLFPGEVTCMLQAIEARCAGRVPAAYLTGEAWLRGMRFICDARALIPRSLIVEAIDEGLSAWLEGEDPASVIDLCTGAGSIAIAAAHRWPTSRITATDLSAAALALARENLLLHAVEKRIDLREGDLFAALGKPLGKQKFDLILSNPPYVNQLSIDALAPEFLHEPIGALAGGTDGMDLVRRILREAPRHLKARGHLLLEIGHEAAHFEAAFPALEFTYLPVAAGDNLLVLVSAEQLAKGQA